MTQQPYLTDADLADMYGTTPERIAIWRRKHSWPHLRIGKTVRYTAEHVAQIERLQTAATKPAPKGLPGQTARSAARRRSS